MTNIAIIIGVSQYENLDPLPACRNDALLLSSIIDETGRYDHKLVVVTDEDTRGYKTKALVAAFIKKVAAEHERCGEVFFYFSGHGSNEGGEFQMLLSDHSRSRQKQTSVSMAELDEMLRAVSPDVCAKIIDACQSGTDYIKNKSSISDGLEESRGRFKTCYFMHSSLASEFSFADEYLSCFAVEFARSLLRKEGVVVRFKDIEDYISDAFQTDALSNRQTPHFVHQGPHTAEFCVVTASLENAILSAIGDKLPSTDDSGEPATEDVHGATEPDPFILSVLESSKLCCSEEEVRSILRDIRSSFAGFSFSPQLLHLFTVEVQDVCVRDLPDVKRLASWLSERAHEYFACVDTEAERYTVEVPYQKRVNHRSPFMAALMALGDDTVTEWREVEKTKMVPSSFHHTWTPPFEALVVEFQPVPGILGISPYRLYFSFAVSRREIVMFSADAGLRESSFDNWLLPEAIEWKSRMLPLKGDRSAISEVERMLSEFQVRVLESIPRK